MSDNRALDLTERRREYRKALKASVDEVVRKLSGMNVDRLSLFGSYTTGKADLSGVVIIKLFLPFMKRPKHEKLCTCRPKD